MEAGLIEVDGKNIRGVKDVSIPLSSELEAVKVKSTTIAATTILGGASNIGRDVAARIFMGLNYDDAVSCGLLNTRWKAWFDYFLAHASTELRLHTNKIDKYGLSQRSVDLLNVAKTPPSDKATRSTCEEKESKRNQEYPNHLSSARFVRFTRFASLIGSCCSRLQSLAIDLNLSNLSNFADGKQANQTILVICSDCPKLQSLSLSIFAGSKMPTLLGASSPISPFAGVNPTTLSTFLRQLTELKLLKGPLRQDDLKPFVEYADPVAIFVSQLVSTITGGLGKLPENFFSSLKKLTIESTDLKSFPLWTDQRQLWQACGNVEELTWRSLSLTQFSSICWSTGFSKLERLHLSNWLIGSVIDFFAWISINSSLTHLTMENVSFENLHYGDYVALRPGHCNHLLSIDLGKQCAINCKNSRFLDECILYSPHLVMLTFSLHTHFESDLLSNNSEYQWTRALLAKLKLLKNLRHLTIHLTGQDQIPFVCRIVQNHLSPFPPAFELNLLVDALAV